MITPLEHVMEQLKYFNEFMTEVEKDIARLKRRVKKLETACEAKLVLGGKK